MKLIEYIFFIILVRVTCTSTTSLTGKLRIIGGKTAKDGELSYQISIQKLNFFWPKSHYCGGAIISENCILTAGHCLIGLKPTDIVVLAGIIKLSETNIDKNSSTTLEFTPYELIPYPEYDNNKNEHDIGIIKLKSKMEIKQNVQLHPISLWEFESKIPVNMSCTVSGWGYTEEYGSISDILMFADVPTRNESECRALYNRKYEIFGSMMCTGYTDGGINSCYGDSGGPLVCDGKLTGITSFGIGCARAEYPAIYTKVSYYTKWIESQNCYRPNGYNPEADGNKISSENITISNESLLSKFATFLKKVLL